MITGIVANKVVLGMVLIVVIDQEEIHQDNRK